jgi:hypothetical protein
MKDLKEENDIKGKVIAIQQKLLEIAVQMFQEKKDECEELKIRCSQHDDVESEQYDKIIWQQEEIKQKEMENENLRKQIEELKGGKDNG